MMLNKNMIETPFNYTGSKFKLLEQLLTEFDYTKTTFVDVFCGGGSVYTNVLDRYDRVIINDIISDLIGIHNGLMLSDNIIEITKTLCPGKGNPEGYAKLREDYNTNPSPEKLWALMLSCTNNMMRFNQKFKFNQTYGDRGWNSKTDTKVEKFVNHIRNHVSKVEYLSNHFEDLEFNQDTMLYIDPPYSNTEAGYNAFWKKDYDLKLYNWIKDKDSKGCSFAVSGSLSHDGKSCLLLDMLIEDGYTCVEFEYDYNKVSRVGKKETKEVLIKNY
jgi:DNA adenine methylase Dam